MSQGVGGVNIIKTHNETTTISATALKSAPKSAHDSIGFLFLSLSFDRSLGPDEKYDIDCYYLLFCLTLPDDCH